MLQTKLFAKHDTCVICTQHEISFPATWYAPRPPKMCVLHLRSTRGIADLGQGCPFQAMFNQHVAVPEKELN